MTPNNIQHFRAHSRSIAALFPTGDYSDLTIVCGDDRYKVHKAIVCSRSPFFKNACDGNFEESQTSEVKLPDDNPVAVRMMVEYLYLHTYTPPLTSTHDPEIDAELSPTIYNDKRKNDMELWGASFVGNKRIKTLYSRPIESSRGTPMFTGPFSSSPAPVHPASRSLSSRITQPTQFPVHGSDSVQLTPNPPSPSPPASESSRSPTANLCLHAKVYALGEKYGIEHLKVFALQKFEAEVESHLHRKDFLLAIEEAYTSTVEEDRGLRDVIVNTMKKHKYLLKKLSVQAIVKSTQLGFDLLINLASVQEEK